MPRRLRPGPWAMGRRAGRGWRRPRHVSRSRRTAASPATRASLSGSSSSSAMSRSELGSGPRDPYRQAMAARTAGLGSRARAGSPGIADSAVSSATAPSARIAASRTRASGSNRDASAAATAVGGPPSTRIASSAATRTVGSGSSSTQATSAAPAPSTDVRPRDVRPSRSAAIRRVLGCGALRASTRAAMTAGSAVSTARPGPPSRTCSPSPARSVRSRLAA